MRILTGRVISKKMAKTATVAVEKVITHPVYKKRVKRVKKYQVHDEFDTNIGDLVNFADSKPFSKTKKWKIIKVEKGHRLVATGAKAPLALSGPMARRGKK
ncbi:30S ribosomal protein S17 [Candidatus Woesebacteria bacterium]|nr:30S ribosomal protein S17 [Candidatus Woesebacteria bacterium]